MALYRKSESGMVFVSYTLLRSSIHTLFVSHTVGTIFCPSKLKSPLFLNGLLVKSAIEGQIKDELL